MIDLWSVTPGEDEDSLTDQLIWLRQDLHDPQLDALARERFALLRGVAERLPPLGVAPELAARLVAAQWQGALNQCGGWSPRANSPTMSPKAPWRPGSRWPAPPDLVVL